MLVLVVCFFQIAKLSDISLSKHVMVGSYEYTISSNALLITIASCLFLNATAISQSATAVTVCDLFGAQGKMKPHNGLK